MARKKASTKHTKEERYNQIRLLVAELARSRNLPEDVVINALLEAIRKTQVKAFGGEGDAASVDIVTEIDDEAKEIRIYYFKEVVDVVNDDALEISKEEFEKLEDPLIVDGKYVFRTLTVNDLTELQMKSVQNQFISQLRDLEKEKLVSKFSSKIGELVMGKIEIVSPRTTMVNLGDISVLLDERRHTINHEKFLDQSLVPFVILDVVSTPRGANIIISRTDPLFVRRLMEREVPEIYDGTVVIHNIVREPGERCKVSVESTEPNVDPVGACIGPNGARIQKVSSELGPNSYKEKIDIIPYSENIGVYIMDAFLPAEPFGIVLDEENKKALVIVENGDKGRALGQKGANIRMASALIGYELDVMELEEAMQEEIVYKTRDTLIYEQNLLEQERANIRRLEQMQEEAEEEIVETPVVTTVPQMSMAEALKEHEQELVREKEEKAAEEKVEVKEEKEAEDDKKVKSVKITISLAELEKELDKEKETKQKQTRKPKKKTEDKVEEKVSKSDIEETRSTGPKMDIYTEEELREIEEMERRESEENDYDYYDDIDYDEFDEYYDE